MAFLNFSACLRFAAFIFALYICITGLFSNFVDLPNHPAKHKDSATAKNIVLIVIDALRSDMISSPKYSDNWPMLKQIMQQGIVECSTATLSSPTVTAPRIKAISTGRLSEFLDAIYNTESLAVVHDSWVRRLAENRKRLEIYGDDTWLKLFPKSFTRADGTSSFFVNDFYEVSTAPVDPLCVFFWEKNTGKGITEKRETGMAISGLLLSISQSYSIPRGAPPET
ncbi:unnamed protein product [Dibothriocephalus latus]|uniref:GPI ethanolamine phosphate transferase 2 n=1 Tax=Dibothriocephalus latus TaxID=60516 RepID=A0A3P7L4P9_DIBLA|nr:unnamed protein product [Dibothriocephalus latus]